MFDFIFLIGMLLAFGSVVYFIYSFFKKNGRMKQAVIMMLVGFVLLVFGAVMSDTVPAEDNKKPLVIKETEESQESLEIEQLKKVEEVEEAKEVEEEKEAENPDEKEAKENLTNEEQVEEVDISYEIFDKDDLSIGNAIRYRFNVIIKENATKDELEKLSRRIIEEAKKQEKVFNAITIGFYDYKEFIDYGFTLGYTDYAPNGDWSKAAQVKKGDYEKMDYKFGIQEKDWDIQLTQEEAKIFRAWHELYMIGSDEELADESEITREIAEKFGKDPEEVNKIFTKHLMWLMSDEG